MRRKHCEIKDPKEMIRILASTNIGRLATVDAEGYPYITPLNFVSHEGCVYFHCAPEGEKLDNLTRDPRVCFEVDVPLAYLEVDFNPDRDPCRTHQLYHSVIIRGSARIVPGGALKTNVLNALVEKHEGNRDFSTVTSDSTGYKTCWVVEIRPERMTAKSDLAQNKPQQDYRHFIAEHLVERGLPGDLEAVRAMGYELERNERGGWRIKG
ncbi:MAG: pyridoxamine 5'-phosphate oxidase family protein [Deltaproteobacteria bacterium]|nr:pyridoxamine 5'-phosphate oxidase family protein [Deltaproteobacteria bacterium]